MTAMMKFTDTFQVIPTPSSLADFDTREFSSENHVYSSFAYLIGSTRGVAQILAATPPDKKTSPPIELVEAVDAMIDGWLLLLPECKRPLMSKDGEIDELLFYAHMGIHAYVTLPIALVQVCNILTL